MLKAKQRPDYFLLALIGTLLIVGLILLNSASSVMSYRNFENSFYYLGHQLLAGVLPGILLFILFYNLRLETIKNFSKIIFFTSLFLMLLVLFPGMGISHGEAQRWISLGIFSFQPIEIFKLCLIIFLAYFFSRRQQEINNFYQTILPFILVLASGILLIVFQKNFSGVVIIFFIALSIYWIAGAGLKTIVGLFSFGLLGAVFLVTKESYRLSRIISFLNPGVDTRGASYHVQQALIAIGSGGIFGRGLGFSGQKFFYLPESFGDSIFAIIAEETGFIFTSFLIGLFFLLVWRALKIAKNSNDSFSRSVATGIAVWFGTQIIINIGGMLAILPITGVPLPLISFGGSAMTANLAALGLLLNVSKKIS